MQLASIVFLLNRVFFSILQQKSLLIYYIKHVHKLLTQNAYTSPIFKCDFCMKIEHTFHHLLMIKFKKIINKYDTAYFHKP